MTAPDVSALRRAVAAADDETLLSEQREVRGLLLAMCAIEPPWMPMSQERRGLLDAFVALNDEVYRRGLAVPS